MTWFTKSAKPPSPVQIRAAPPITTSVSAVTYGNGLFERVLFHRSADVVCTSHDIAPARD
jgi:hypothetical protein